MRYAACAIVLCLLTACGGTSSAVGGDVCPTITMSGSLIYPAGQQPAVDAPGVVVVAGGLNPGTLTLTPAAGNAIVSSAIVPIPNPLPAPHAFSQLAPTTAFSIPPLSAATTYAVSAVAAPPCTTRSTFGSFTTQ